MGQKHSNASSGELRGPAGSFGPVKTPSCTERGEGGREKLKRGDITGTGGCCRVGGLKSSVNYGLDSCQLEQGGVTSRAGRVSA